jgi:acyl dehydratase
MRGIGAPPGFTVGPITRTDIVRYQGASGDFNPIHHDDAFAQDGGYATVFSVGMLQAGLLASFACTWLGSRNIRRFSVRFREQVWPGDVLTFSGEVLDLSADDDNGLEATVSLECRRTGGGVAIAGTAVFALTPSPDGISPG